MIVSTKFHVFNHFEYAIHVLIRIFSFFFFFPFSFSSFLRVRSSKPRVDADFPRTVEMRREYQEGTDFPVSLEDEKLLKMQNVFSMRERLSSTESIRVRTSARQLRLSQANLCQSPLESKMTSYPASRLALNW